MGTDFAYGVVAVPHESKGEQIVLVTNNKKVTQDLLHIYIRNNGMSELYLPRLILYHDTLPMFATGKADNVTQKRGYGRIRTGSADCSEVIKSPVFFN